MQLDIEMATAALAIVSFERLVISGCVTKHNRRLSMAVCLLLAHKFYEPVYPMKEGEEEGGEGGGGATIAGWAGERAGGGGGGGPSSGGEGQGFSFLSESHDTEDEGCISKERDLNKVGKIYIHMHMLIHTYICT